MKISHKLSSFGWSLGAAVLAATLGASPAFAQGNAVVPQNGFWADPSAVGGRAVVIEVIPATGELFASTLVYDETGRAIWYVVNTVPNATVRQGMLQKFVGGQTLNSNFRAGTFLEFVGSATFHFTTPTTGTVDLPGGVMNIQRFDIVNGGSFAGPSAGGPAGGWWYAPAENGRGYFLESQSNVLFFTALEYNDLGQSTWYYSRGEMTTPTMYSGALVESYGGQTMTGPYTQATQNFVHGNVSIQFTSATTATVTEPSGRQTPIVRYGF